MNLVLIGYRGAGKTAVGRELAARLGRRFVDTDELVEEREGTAIREIVEARGWNHFRSVEKEVIAAIGRENGLVVAPGGGAVLDPENVRSLAENGLIVWLKARREVLARRLEGDPGTANRPTLTGKGTGAELQEMLAQREPYYERAAAIQVDTSNLGVSEVAGEIMALLREKGRG